MTTGKELRPFKTRLLAGRRAARPKGSGAMRSEARQNDASAAWRVAPMIYGVNSKTIPQLFGGQPPYTPPVGVVP
jgi:hypothetical protein